MGMPDLGTLQSSLNTAFGSPDLSLVPARLPENRETPEVSPILKLHAVVRKHVHFVLDLNRGNKLKTARQLGISRSTLYRMLDEESIASR
ncbi:MAG TPA: helix-turn-helix domain-containing protein [Terracidiphilus sp.]|jgi:transcriptional regulator of acetoin/glycerol metabolism